MRQTLEKRNPKLVQTLVNHSIPYPTKIINGGYDNSFSDFLMERSILLFSKIKEELIDKHESIKSEFSINK